MKERIATGCLTAILAVAIFIGGYLLGQSQFAPLQLSGAASSTPAEVREEFEPFWEIYSLVQREFFDQAIDDTALVEGAINGLLETLEDPNTRYLTPVDQSSDAERMEGEFQGIGAEVTSDEGAITIVAPFEGSPAAAAGLRTGDILRAADGVDLTDMDVGEAAGLVRGPAGTTVLLTIERDGELFDIEITRDRILLPSVRSELLEDNIAYLRISRFINTTADDVNTQLEELMAQEPDGLIIDVRSNPGGSLGAVVNIADQFVDEGIILTERYGNGEVRVHRSDNDGLAQDIPIVVLIDQGSASASEVLSGALRDRGRAVLIGQTSFGKGTVQGVFVLSNGGGARITVARWLTPDETWVHGEGLDPDYFIPLPDISDLAEDEEAQDTQLQAAIDYLLGETVESIPPAEVVEE